jgi:diguanylate cyclase (GGDEF)-like protein
MKTLKPYLAILLVFFFIVVMLLIPHSGQQISFSDPQELNAGWFYENQEITLPASLEIQPNTSYSIHRLLDNEFEETQILLLRTSLQNITITLDDVLIYEQTYGVEFQKPYASMWHFVSIPMHSSGSTLEITLSTPYAGMSGQINPVFYGNESMHVAYLFRTYGIRLITGFVLLLIGLVVIVSNFIFIRSQDKGFIYTGIFAVLLSLWMIAESRMLQFLTGSEFVIGSLAYLAIPLFPIPLVIYLRDYVLQKYTKWISPLKYIYFGQFVFIIVFNYLGILDFFETVVLSQVWLVVGIIVAMTLLIMEAKKLHNQTAIKFIKVFLFLAFFAAMEIIGFAFSDFRRTSLYLSLGLIVLMVGIMFNYSRYVISRLKISHEKEVYEKLAFMDYLTQGSNRLAFERDIEEIFANPKRKEQLRLVYFDLDDLKHINDEYGHLVGDEAIRRAFTFIQEGFGNQGKCYRIGGDEMACLFENSAEEIYEEKKALMNQLSSTYDQATPFHFALSIGSAVVSSPEMTPEDLMNLADIDMYQYKKEYKSKSIGRK